MAVIEEALVGLLKADGTVAGLVAQRIYPLVIPQNGTLPAITYQKISGARDHSHDGAADLARPRVQFSCVARTYAAAKAVANAVRAALDNYQGTASGVVIDAIHCQNELDVFNLATDQAASSYVVMVDFMVWHHE